MARSVMVGDRYRLGPIVGRGGMGEVRAAEDTRLGRDVALKFLRADLAEQPGVRERFEHEARSAARINHPNVVIVLDTGEHEGQPYIVMERLPGRTLADELADGPLDPARGRAIAVDVLNALAAAHALGIVHRDIKPGNVLLAGPGSYKVADFGIAKSAGGLDHTATGDLVGTASYLAPERLENGEATPVSDLYSLGVMLYEALTGAKPFRGDTPLDTLRLIKEVVPPPVRQLRPEVDPVLAAAVERAIEKDPSRRFVSAAEMAAAITGDARPGPSHVDDAPPTGGEPTAVDPVVAPATHVLTDVPRHAETAPRSPRRFEPSLVVAGAAVAAIALGGVLLDRAGDDRGSLDRTRLTAVTTTPPPADSPGIPEPLDDALDDLDEAVRP